MSKSQQCNGEGMEGDIWCTCDIKRAVSHSALLQRHLTPHALQAFNSHRLYSSCYHTKISMATR